MVRFVILGLTLLLFSSCSPSAPPTSPASEDPSLVPGLPPVSGVEFGIGGVETSLEFELVLSDKTSGDNVQYNPQLTRHYKLAHAEILVRKPYPEELWLKLGVRSDHNFEGHAVQVKPKIFMDGREVASFGFVYGAQAMRDPKEFFVDVSEHLDANASSVLVYASTEINLFPDTDESQITVETPPGPETQSVEKMSNPIRIEFLQ